MRRALFSLWCLTAANLPNPTAAAVSAHPIFSDNAVLQQGIDLPVWGWASDGEPVTVEIDGQKVSTVARNGRWLVRLRPIQNTGPHDLKISGHTEFTAHNVLVGEVWLCAGGSPMERRLSPLGDEPPIAGWEEATSAADLPQIRQFVVSQTRAYLPADRVQGQWVVCTPATAPDFSAVGFFFARQLHRSRKAPVGLVVAARSETPAHAWMSASSLRTFPELTDPLEQITLLRSHSREAQARFTRALNAWLAEFDAGSNTTLNFAAPDLNLVGWSPVELPGAWESTHLEGFDGVVWFRTEFQLPEDWKGLPLVMHLGPIDDVDTTWINGFKVGSSSGASLPRSYRVPPEWLRPGRNSIAVRVLDMGGKGGFWGGSEPMRLQPAEKPSHAISLAGTWWRKTSIALPSATRPPPIDFSQSPAAPTVFYNGMIAPLLPFPMRGVLLYHNEADHDGPDRYRALLSAWIADWRRAWDRPTTPFLFVQSPPHPDQTPEMREAQLLTWLHTPATAMVVTLDCGDSDDAHPIKKAPIGSRLALAARAIAYGERIDFSGPVFDKMRIDGARVWLDFTHRSGGLVCADDGGAEINGFTLCGKDNIFHPAQATIRGDQIGVTSDKVKEPVAVRYAWANLAKGNLINRAGLPASPFRTDGPVQPPSAADDRPTQP